MAKVADRYLLVDPWAIIEEGFDSERGRVSESIFSLGNEYMGVRGYAEEGYSGDTLVGSYFNGLFEEIKLGAHYKGIIRRLRFMASAVDWLYTRIRVGDETLDLAKSKISGFSRKLDFKTGAYSREFIWHLQAGGSIKVSFIRLVSMTKSNLGCQQISFEAIDCTGSVEVRSGLDFNIIHEDQGRNLWEGVRQGGIGEVTAILAQTISTGNRLFSGFTLNTSVPIAPVMIQEDKFIGQDFSLPLAVGSKVSFEKIVANYAELVPPVTSEAVWTMGIELAAQFGALTFAAIAEEQATYWGRVWEASDIEIEGDPENQQGIRFCIFQLYQTYRGENPGFNIGAKGLTGEAYRGLAFWDTESYCLPFYLFNNPKAAKSLLEFRYKTLTEAIERAKEVDCIGACYPIATIDGTESCDLWQHSNLQLHVGTAVGYGIWHYVKTVGDTEFLYEKGIEMLIQISRFYASRGQWGQRSGQYGYFGVMGPDEFQLMVNNNCYINLMAKKLFEYTLESINEMEQVAPEQIKQLIAALALSEQERSTWQRMADNMHIPLDEATGIFEEHDGFFDMPHIDIHSIPVSEFPLYSNWSYDRLYRYDMIKQPDVLMFMFLYNQDFTPEVKRANYEYYEPRCIHESSLSPSIHSILASEIGRNEEAYQFFEFATRLDLDNYNRNTREGLHTTSIAAAWMNIVYGFGGMRSDGAGLVLNPTIPQIWSSYRFKVIYRGTTLSIVTNKDILTIRAESGVSVEVIVYGKAYLIDSVGIELPVQNVIYAGEAVMQ
ncbi:MAG: family 65 glycosyl hydrolase [Gorillibacterium sp.]|nr:family 65 glycosyl hydrolase [Gorillibacterium sp.]